MARKNSLTKPVIDEPRLPLWATYLWQRLNENQRVGLVLGAGVTADAGCPVWSELVGQLSKAMKVPKKRIASHRKAGLSETFIAEVMYRNHCGKEDAKNGEVSLKLRALLSDASWRDEIHHCLYGSLSGRTFDEITKKHLYLKPLAKLICKARFAVTFNFDDIIDEAVTLHAAHNGIPNPEVITRPKVETRKDAPVIYHINGLLPREEVRRASERVILTEDAFADILLSPNSHEAEFVINQFAVKTFLLLGVSLSDNSLKNLLRASAKRNPANHHFIVYHEKDEARRTPEERRDIFDVNLHVYNLISLFLTSAEIAAFIEVLNCDNSGIEHALRKISPGKIDRKYYLVGSVAAGKTTTLEALRCFTTQEEWTGRPPAAMFLNDKTLTREQQREVDQFLFPQLINKNNR